MKKHSYSKIQRITALILTMICLAALVTIPAAASAVMRQNVSSTAVSCNASNGGMPGGVTTVHANSSYYFNVQCDSSCCIKTADLYIKKPGQSSYTRAYTETVGGYMRYTYTKQNVGATGGTLSYYWKLTHTNGSTTTLSASSISVASSAVNRNTSNGSLPASVVPILAGLFNCFNAISSSGIVNMSFEVYQQDNAPFSSLDYSYNGNGRNVGYSGCGPMALVNALRYLGRDLTDAQIKELIAACQDEQDVIRCSTGTHAGNMVGSSDLQNTYRFNYDRTCKVSELAEVLDGTTAVIAGVGNVDLRVGGTDGHIIAIVAYDAATGSALVLDSYQQNHSNHRYAAGQTTPFWYPIGSDPDFFSTGQVISLK